MMRRALKKITGLFVWSFVVIVLVVSSWLRKWTQPME